MLSLNRSYRTPDLKAPVFQPGDEKAFLCSGHRWGNPLPRPNHLTEKGLSPCPDEQSCITTFPCNKKNRNREEAGKEQAGSWQRQPKRSSKSSAIRAHIAPILPRRRPCSIKSPPSISRSFKLIQPSLSFPAKKRSPPWKSSRIRPKTTHIQ